MTTLRSSSTSSKTAGLFAALLLCFCCAAMPSARAKEWIVGGPSSGTTGLPTGGNTTGGSNLVNNGDIITLYTNPTVGGATGAAALGTPLINYQLAVIGSAVPSFTIRSGTGANDPLWDGTWYVITNKKSPSPVNKSMGIGYLAGTSTITLIDVIFADNQTSSNVNSSGAAIWIDAGNSVSTDLTLLTGTAIFRHNGGGSPGLTTDAMLGGAIHYAGAGSLKISGSFTFAANYADRGGALNIANSAQNLIIEGDNLFDSNVANTAGAISFAGAGSGTLSLSGRTQFINNFAGVGTGLAANGVGGGGGAIATAAGLSNATLTMTGTTLFQSNTSAGVGGAIKFGGASLYIGANSTFTDNIAGSTGGAISQYNGGSGSQRDGGVSLTLDATGGDITFRGNLENAGADFSQAGDRNAIMMYSGSYATGGVTTLALNSSAGNAIYFYDPIAVSDTTGAWLGSANQTFVNVNVTGNGTVLFDTYQSAMASGELTLASGTMLLTNGAIYGTGTAGTGETVYLQAPAVLAASNGAIMADSITYDSGAQINVSGGGTLGLYTSAFVGTGLRIYGNGVIDTGGNAISAALVSVGSIVSGTPGAALGANTPQTLTMAPGTTLTIEDGGTLAFDLFANNTSDQLAADTLLLSGSAYINVVGDTAGAYKLITAGNDISGFNFLTQIGGATISFNAAGNELWLDLVIQNSITHWTGAAGGIWMNSLSTNLNWDNGAGNLSFINGDSVVFDDTATLKTVTVDASGVTASDMLVNNSAGNDYTFAGAGAITTDAAGDATATGKLIKTGAGAANFTNTGSNNFTGGIEISGGAIGFTDGSQLGDGGNGIHFTGDGALLANADNISLANNLIVDAGKTATLDTAANTLAYTGTLYLSTTGTLAKTGAGTLRISTDNSGNTGSVLVSQGVLFLDADGSPGAPASSQAAPVSRLGIPALGAAAPSSLAAPALTADGKLGGVIDIADGATLAGNGEATGTVNAGPGAIIAPGALSPNSPVTLTINNLNLDNTTLRFNLFADNASDAINVTGALTGATLNNTIDIALFQTGTFDLGNIVGTLTGAQVTINGNSQAGGGRQSAVVSNDGIGNLQLKSNADMSRILTWTGATSNTWTPNDADWTNKNTTEAVSLFAGGDRVYFDDTAPAAAAPHTIDIAGSGVNVSDMFVDGASSYTFTGAAGINADPATLVSGTVITTGSGMLTKAGSGTLAFENTAANNFSGGIVLDGGALTYTDPAQLGDGGAGGNDITFTGNAALAYAGAPLATPSDITLANNITVAAGMTGTLADGGNNLTLSGILSSGNADLPIGSVTTGTLAKIGSGTLSLTGNNAGAASANLVVALNEGAALLNNTVFAGRIDASADTTIVNAAGTTNSVRLRMAAGSTLTGSGTLAGSARLDGAVAADIAVGAVLTLSGTVNGAGGFLKTSAGELQLNGAAALRNTGLTQIDQGTLRITGISGFTTGIDAVIPAGTLTILDSSVVIDAYTIAISDSTSIVVPSSTFAFDTYGVIPSADTPVTVIVPENSFEYDGATIIIPGQTIVATDTTAALASGTIAIVPSVNQASAVSQNLMLNGGTLAFGAAGAAAPNELTANDWAGVRLTQGDNAASSVVTGANDIIHVGPGDQQYAIQNGIIVAVDAGDAAGGTVVLSNTANNFTGIVRIDSGTLQVTSSTGLGAMGTGNTAKVALNGGALQISSSLTTTRAIDLRTDSIIDVDDGMTTQWNSITHTTTSPGYTPQASLTKAGSGTLSINGNNGIQSTSLTVAAGRVVLHGTPQGLNTNSAVAINAGATVEFASTGTGNANNPVGFVGGSGTDNLYYYSTSGASSPAYTGGGTLEITGGRIEFTSPNTTVANIAIAGANSAAVLISNWPLMNFGPDSNITVADQGIIVMGAVGTKMGNVTMSNGGTIAFLLNATQIASSTNAATGVVTPAYWSPNAQGFRTATFTTLTSTGDGNALLFNSNIGLNMADHLTITGAATGTIAIGITNWGTVPARFNSALELIKMQDPASDATFVPVTPEIDIGLYKYTVGTTSAGGATSLVINGTGAMSNSASLINSVAAALPQSWFAELDTVTQRLGELHFENRDDKAGLSAWLRGYGERLNFNDKLTGSGFHETHYAGEAGLDYKVGGVTNNIYLGAYAGYGSAQRDLNASGDATSDSAFGGLYATVSTPAGWYLDLTAKFNNFKTRLTAISPTGERATADYRNWAIGGSLELGKRIDIGSGLFWEPQVQGALTTLTGGSYQTSAGMTVTQLPATILRARAGLRLGYDMETTSGMLSIYLKAGGGSQWAYDGQMNIATAAGQVSRYSPVITGNFLEAGAGLAWRFSKATQVYIDYSTTDAAYYIKPWSVNAGLRYSW